MRRSLRLFVVAAVLGGLVLLMGAGPVLGVDATVSSTCDEAEVDSALALVQGSGGGKITIDYAPGKVFNVTQKKTISADVEIDGSRTAYPGVKLDGG